MLPQLRVVEVEKGTGWMVARLTFKAGLRRPNVPTGPTHTQSSAP